MSLGCRHGWYCTRCVQQHAEARLGVGDVHVPCPECRAPVPERDLRKLLPADVVDRLLARSLERAVSTESDLWACPTPNCPMRVALDEGDDGELARLHCPLCRKTSCLRCRAQPFHKGLSCEAHAQRQRSRAHRVARAAEEGLRQWMEETGSKQCPRCNMVVTKQNLRSQATQHAECHKMMCANCNTKFCFKCLAVLTDTFTCGCSIDLHGFVDPRTGKRINHLKRGYGRGRGAAKSGRGGARGAQAQGRGKAALGRGGGVGRGTAAAGGRGGRGAAALGRGGRGVVRVKGKR